MPAAPSAVTASCRRVGRHRPAAGCVNRSTKARAEGGRSAGTLARPLAMACSTCGGTCGRTVRGGRGRSVSTRATIAWTLGPVNGGSPTSISYSTAASAYTSLRASRRSAPPACSGLMYSAVPGVSPAPVSEDWPPFTCSISFAIPKSATIACARESRMLAGFTSRCRTPTSCAYCRASPTSAAIRSASASGRARRSNSGSADMAGWKWQHYATSVTRWQAESLRPERIRRCGAGRAAGGVAPPPQTVVIRAESGAELRVLRRHAMVLERQPPLLSEVDLVVDGDEHRPVAPRRPARVHPPVRPPGSKPRRWVRGLGLDAGNDAAVRDAAHRELLDMGLRLDERAVVTGRSHPPLHEVHELPLRVGRIGGELE